MKSLFCTLLIAVSCCATGFAQQQNAPSRVVSSDMIEAVQGNNAFALDLYAGLRSSPGNLFFSPESISTTFAMAYAGAHGQTAAEMARVLHYTLPAARLHPAMGALLDGLNAPHTGYELHVADAVWAQQDLGFLNGYLKLTGENYKAGFQRVNYKTAPEAARATINRWVEQQTNDRIQDLIGPGVLTRDTRLVLTNAIYFKGDWRDPFDKTETRDETFHLTAAQQEQVPLMHRTGGYRYYDGGSFQALEMPYAGNELAMVVLLPKATDGLPALEKTFTAEAAREWINKLVPAGKVILTLPRFKMTQQFELSRRLAAMGMPLAFSNAADFSAMTGKPDLAITAAIHKAFIDVNEKGTEAAAATALTFRATAIRRPTPEPPPIVFCADHPFLFLLRDTQTGSILFLGRVADPAK